MRAPNDGDLWSDVALRPFLGEIKRKYGVVETLALPNMRDLPPVRIEKLFVQPRLSSTQVAQSTSLESWPTGESLQDAIRDYRRVVLLGDPGSGKTTLANWLAWRLAAGLTSPLPPGLANNIPVPCVLRELEVAFLQSSPNIERLVLHITERLLGNRFDPVVRDSVISRVRAKQFVLILDGIDEIPVESRAAVAGWMQEAAAEDICVVATARVIGYEDCPIHIACDALERKPVRTEKAEQANPADGIEAIESNWATVKYLMPFDQQRIAAFVENWYLQRLTSEVDARKRADDLLVAIQASSQMQELARTPNLLSLMAIVHRERTQLPDGKALLYKEISNAYINTIDLHRKISPGNDLHNFSWEIKETWLAYVGFRMQLARDVSHGKASGGGVLVRVEQVTKWLAESMTLSNVENALPKAEEFLAWVARRSGLLIPRGDNLYAFVHLSFQEYFCARFLVSKVMSRAFVRNQLALDAPVTPALLRTWARGPVWFESFVYMFELVSALYETEWVDDLVELVFGDGNHLSDDLPKLAARLIADQHVHVDRGLRARLARGVSQDAFYEWRFHSSLGDRQSLAGLLNAGFGLLIVDGAVTDNIETDGLSWRTCADISSFDSYQDDVFLFIAAGKTVSSLSDLSPSLRYVGIYDASVATLDGLAHCHSLKAIEVERTSLCNISGLSACAELEEIYLVDTHVSDLLPLAELVSIEVAQFDRCHLNDISALAKLGKMQWLSLDGNPFSDISCVSGMPDLKYLSLDFCNVHSLEPLQDLRRLASLSLRSSKAVTLAPLGRCTDLVTLFLNGTEISDSSVLRQLVGLSDLSIVNTGIKDFEFLKELRELDRLRIDYFDSSVLKAVSDTSLRSVVVGRLVDIDPGTVFAESNIHVIQVGSKVFSRRAWAANKSAIK